MIRPEQPGDEAAIRALTTAAFASTPHSGGNEAAIVDALRAADALVLSFVALKHDIIVGHVAISPVTVDGSDCGWFGLGPVSVLPDRQRLGIGTALIEAALEHLRADEAAGCVLLGDPAYYARFGFVADPALTYPGAPPDYFQCIVLAGPPAQGEVRYHQGFDAT